MRAVPREIRWAALLAVVLLAGGGWWLLRAGGVHLVPPATPTPIIPKDIELRLNHVRLHGVSGGKVVWEIDADNFNFAKDRPLLTVQGVKRIALINAGKQELTLSAGTLTRNTVTGDISVTDNVTIAGNGILIHTPAVAWDPRAEALVLPGQCAMQVGDYLVSSLGASRYQMHTGLLTSTGGVTLTLRGSTLRAGGIAVAVASGEYTLTEPVAAELAVADLADWAAGKHLPALPDIPAGIRQRYQEFCARQHTKPAGTGKGVHR